MGNKKAPPERGPVGFTYMVIPDVVTTTPSAPSTRYTWPSRISVNVSALYGLYDTLRPCKAMWNVATVPHTNACTFLRFSRRTRSRPACETLKDTSTSVIWSTWSITFQRPLTFACTDRQRLCRLR